MTTLVLQTSTPPVQFDIVFLGHVLELRSEYVLNTLLITRPSRFAAFWSHVLKFTCACQVSGQLIDHFRILATLLGNRCQLAFWSRSGYVLTRFGAWHQ